jgi:hypothetical protein
MMKAFVSSFSTPKLGNSIRECEDAYAILPRVGSDEMIEQGPIVASVADGASESLLSGYWARSLTASLTSSVILNQDSVRDTAMFADAVALALDGWDAWLVNYILEREALDKPIRWYERPKLDRGSHAAFLTAHFADPTGETGAWSACGLGDVCLFHIRDNTLLQAFPLTSFAEFSNSPQLIGTKNTDIALVALRTNFVEGTYRTGDQFFIGTDAFSAWFLDRTDNGGLPWNLLRDLTCSPNPDDFESWSREERSSGRMRNDDIAIVHVDMG